MFDKVNIKARIDVDDIDTIVLRNYLEQCTEGDELFYKSTAYANFDGCFIEVRGSALIVRTALRNVIGLLLSSFPDCSFSYSLLMLHLHFNVLPLTSIKQPSKFA